MNCELVPLLFNLDTTTSAASLEISEGGDGISQRGAEWLKTWLGQTAKNLEG